MSLLDSIKSPLEFGAPDGRASDADMAAINRHASRPVTADQVFAFPMVVANKSISGYAIRMGESSLRKFSESAQRGAPMHAQHARMAQAVAYTYAGHYDEATGESRAAAFITRGRTVTGGGTVLLTDQEISDIEQSIRRNVSVGASGPFIEIVCELCGKEVMSGLSEANGCWHLPGIKYDGKFATARMENADACEISLVDTGSVPGSGIGRTPTGAGTLIVPPADTVIVPSGQFSFAAPLAAKAVQLFRNGSLSKTDYSQWMQMREQADPTVFHSTPPATKPGEKETDMSLLQEARTRLLALGMTFAATLPEGDALTPAAFAEAVRTGYATALETAKRESAESHPLVAACFAAGVKTPDEIKATFAQAADGKSYADAVKKELEKQATRRWADKGPARFAASSHLPVADMAEIAQEWELEANEKYGVGKDRTSAPPAPKPRRFSASAEEGGDDNGAGTGDENEPDAVDVAQRARYGKLPDFAGGRR